MQGPGWISVLGRIPQQHHDSLIIVTVNTAEIIMRELVRLEDDFVVLRGRMAGSTDAGRIIILPFDQINYLGFNKTLPEAEIQAIFGGPAGQAAAYSKAAPVPERAPAPEPPPTFSSQGGTPGPLPAALAGRGAGMPAHPSKSLLLARLRARLANDGAGPAER